MAVRMSEARRLNGSKVNTETEGIEKEKLICLTCNAGVSFVRAYEKRPDVTPRPVPAHFRLRKGEVHKLGCGPTITKNKRIRARRDEKGIIQSLRENKFEIRLLIGRRSVSKGGPPSKPAAASRTSVTYERSSEYLAPYISKAKDVLLVEGEISKNPDLADKIRLNDGEIEIPWRDFYFERTDYDRFFKLASSLRWLHGMPAAVRGVIWDSFPRPKNALMHAVINLARLRQSPNSQGGNDDFYCSIWSEKLSAFDDFQAGQEIVAYGIWQAWTRSPNANAIAHNIEMRPTYQAQVCAVRKQRRQIDSIQQQLTG